MQQPYYKQQQCPQYQTKCFDTVFNVNCWVIVNNFKKKILDRAFDSINNMKEDIKLKVNFKSTTNNKTSIVETKIPNQ